MALLRQGGRPRAATPTMAEVEASASAPDPADDGGRCLRRLDVQLQAQPLGELVERPQRATTVAELVEQLDQPPVARSRPAVARAAARRPAAAAPAGSPPRARSSAVAQAASAPARAAGLARSPAIPRMRALRSRRTRSAGRRHRGRRHRRDVPPPPARSNSTASQPSSPVSSPTSSSPRLAISSGPRTRRIWCSALPEGIARVFLIGLGPEEGVEGVPTMESAWPGEGEVGQETGALGVGQHVDRAGVPGPSSASVPSTRRENIEAQSYLPQRFNASQRTHNAPTASWSRHHAAGGEG